MHITPFYSIILSMKLSVITVGFLLVLFILCNESMPQPNVASLSKKILKNLMYICSLEKH